eukprot:1030669-Rhodomonas_salina.1
MRWIRGAVGQHRSDQIAQHTCTSDPIRSHNTRLRSDAIGQHTRHPISNHTPHASHQIRSDQTMHIQSDLKPPPNLPWLSSILGQSTDHL